MILHLLSLTIPHLLCHTILLRPYLERPAFDIHPHSWGEGGGVWLWRDWSQSPLGFPRLSSSFLPVLSIPIVLGCESHSPVNAMSNTLRIHMYQSDSAHRNLQNPISTNRSKILTNVSHSEHQAVNGAATSSWTRTGSAHRGSQLPASR